MVDEDIMAEITLVDSNEQVARFLEDFANKLRHGEIEALRWEVFDNDMPQPWIPEYPSTYRPIHFKMTLDYKIVPADDWHVLVKG